LPFPNPSLSGPRRRDPLPLALFFSPTSLVPISLYFCLLLPVIEVQSLTLFLSSYCLSLYFQFLPLFVELSPSFYNSRGSLSFFYEGAHHPLLPYDVHPPLFQFNYSLPYPIQTLSSLFHLFFSSHVLPAPLECLTFGPSEAFPSYCVF